MKKSLMFIALPLMLAVLPSAHGAEDKACNDRSVMIDTLVAVYGEQLTEVHEIEGKGLLEFHVSHKEGTWTALLTKGNGISCVLAVGDGIDPAKTWDLATGSPI